MDLTYPLIALAVIASFLAVVLAARDGRIRTLESMLDDRHADSEAKAKKLEADRQAHNRLVLQMLNADHKNQYVVNDYRDIVLYVAGVEEDYFDAKDAEADIIKQLTKGARYE